MYSWGSSDDKELVEKLHFGIYSLYEERRENLFLLQEVLLSIERFTHWKHLQVLQCPDCRSYIAHIKLGLQISMTFIKILENVEKCPQNFQKPKAIK